MQNYKRRSQLNERFGQNMWFLNDHDIKCKYLPITLLRIKNISSEYTVLPPTPKKKKINYQVLAKPLEDSCTQTTA